MLKLIYPLCMLLFLGQCHDDGTISLSPQPEVQHDGIRFGQVFNLTKGEAITLHGGEAPRRLYLTLEQLADSRCPANATCVHYGKATVILSASNSQGKSNNIELCIGECAPGDMRSTQDTTIQVGQTNYKITLQDVQPYPGAELKGETKRAKLLVEKQ